LRRAHRSGDCGAVSVLLILGMLAFCWWAQRDAFRMGREMGRLDERRERLERVLVEQKRHLRVVK
jgi:ABC-type transporter Mla subunit MlaD